MPLKATFITCISQDRRAQHTMHTPGKHQVWAQGRNRSREEACTRFFTAVSTGKARQGRINSLGLPGLSSSRGF